MAIENSCITKNVTERKLNYLSIYLSRANGFEKIKHLSWCFGGKVGLQEACMKYTCLPQPLRQYVIWAAQNQTSIDERWSEHCQESLLAWVKILLKDHCIIITGNYNACETSSI